MGRPVFAGLSRGRRAWPIGPFVVTTTMQAGAAPIADRATVTEPEELGGRRWKGWAILLAQWCVSKRNRKPGLALVFGRRSA